MKLVLLLVSKKETDYLYRYSTRKKFASGNLIAFDFVDNGWRRRPQKEIRNGRIILDNLIR